jgi:hypothetical protein
MTRVVPVVITGITILALLAVLGAGASVPGHLAPSADTDALGSGEADTTTGQSDETTVMTTQSTLDETAAFGRTTASPEAGTFLAGKGARFNAIYQKHLIKEKVSRAENGSRRRSELLDGAARLQRTVGALRSAHRQAYRSYQAGAIDEQTLLFRLVLLHMAANGYEDPVGTLNQLDDRVADTSVDEEYRALRGDVLTMQGALRSDVVASMEGNNPQPVVYTMTDRNGTVLVSLSNSRFVREAYRDDRRTRGTGAIDDISSFNSKAESLYPWITTVDPLDTIRGGPTGDLVSVDLVANENEIVSLHMNGQDKSVVREDKRLFTRNIPTREAQISSDGTMLLQVNRTYSTGPTKVTLLEADTRQPLVGEILVNNESVGRTNSDGTIWIVEPPGETEITATLGTRSLSMTLNTDTDSPRPTPEQQDTPDHQTTDGESPGEIPSRNNIAVDRIFEYNSTESGRFPD